MAAKGFWSERVVQQILEGRWDELARFVGLKKAPVSARQARAMAYLMCRAVQLADLKDEQESRSKR